MKTSKKKLRSENRSKKKRPKWGDLPGETVTKILAISLCRDIKIFKKMYLF